MKIKKKYQESIDRLKVQYPQYQWDFSPEFFEFLEEFMKKNHYALRELAKR